MKSSKGRDLKVKAEHNYQRDAHTHAVDALLRQLMPIHVSVHVHIHMYGENLKKDSPKMRHRCCGGITGWKRSEEVEATKQTHERLALRQRFGQCCQTIEFHISCSSAGSCKTTSRNVCRWLLDRFNWSSFKKGAPSPT
jgi:hypothetical protein